ncbi:SDR family oxidoreductase [Virgibacillus halodenitrificans]|uniref:SDR family oxidoreductase n=1 Tax=Virgibacillus halodenitrificans TaxID=1482 RepID=UPI0002DFC96C|nr:SDR family oxidoreductase [Virgibacillus halodenitrificans]MCG1029406.1 SDR family oxidoreductase [Virgibacillus halodenitrificans]MCJ0931418.1 SDR family oxidoreductase [Virgibacillus halodenitrificans]MYL47352.1 SDR family NAD(P)-dependent oxidoreductase [Virgibacillus halodenitrificans]CDQ36058.1 putative oxidoreductase [Virgibacillus halodenitrificans]
MDLIGKTAIITGASSGIGKGIAKHLSDVGVNVVLAARNKEKLAGVAEEINQSMQGKALAVETDVSNKEDMDVLIKQARNTFGKVDIFVNNAGQMLHSRVQDGHVDEWEKMIDVNIKGVLYGIHGVLPEMLERKSGHIINIASVSGHEVTKVSTVYSATKFAVRAISMGLEKELAKTGVRVTNISPGKVDTDLASASQSSDRKPLHTDDIAKSVIYAVSQPDYVNVNEITVRPV